MSAHIHLELPDVLPSRSTFHVKGWVRSREPLTGVWAHGPTPTALALRSRPDVIAAYPDEPESCGFSGLVSRENLAGSVLTLSAQSAAGVLTASFTLASESAEVLALRRNRRERIYRVLRCLDCCSAFPANGYSTTVIRCAACGREYDCSNGYFDMLPSEQRHAYDPTNDDNISAHPYDPETLALIDKLKDGLVLDCGAGLRPTEYANVVNLEVAPYRSTDVLGVNQRLPFADASFDGVLSLAVLEHVKDPFASAKEIARVLKPGGELFVVVPLLAPVHAYPDHYYNMTSAGLVNLFAEHFDVTETKVPPSGLPVWALTWMLRSWAEGLDADTRRSFLKLSVADLLGEGHTYLERDFVKRLPAEKNFELAATTQLRGRKRAAP